MSKRGQEPAYPGYRFASLGGASQIERSGGMSTRLRIASEQMAGMWANQGYIGIAARQAQTNGIEVAEQVAKEAVFAADALLAAEEETR